ncbi:Nn.00g025910.m01.CDS01 [Neocucurbitaria sp. VM-36]
MRNPFKPKSTPTKIASDNDMPTNPSTPQAFPPVIAQYSGENFVVGGGVAIFHVATERVVICSAHDRRGTKYYFLPKGRRDAGEESGRGAEREGYEESGYRNRLLPLPTKHRQPQAHPRVHALPLTAEAVWMQFMPLGSRQYVLYWYIAETLPPNLEKELETEAGAAYKPPTPYPKTLTLRERIRMEPEGYEPLHHEGTGVDEEEQTYESHLVPVEEAIAKLGRGSVMADVVLKGWNGIQDRFAIEDAATSESPEAIS